MTSHQSRLTGCRMAASTAPGRLSSEVGRSNAAWARPPGMELVLREESLPTWVGMPTSRGVDIGVEMIGPFQGD
jgi:hypothetical protein